MCLREISLKRKLIGSLCSTKATLMVTVNLKIFEELKSFLIVVIEDVEIRKLFTTNFPDFVRVRKLPLKK